MSSTRSSESCTTPYGSSRRRSRTARPSPAADPRRSSCPSRSRTTRRAFAGALDVIPRTLGENAGLDPIDVLIKLRAEHQKKGGKAMGVNVLTGEPLDMIKANVIEPLRVKVQEIDSAAEVAAMILRIDDVIASKKSPPPPPGGGEHGHGGGMGGMGGMPPGMGM